MDPAGSDKKARTQGRGGGGGGGSTAGSAVVMAGHVHDQQIFYFGGNTAKPPKPPHLLIAEVGDDELVARGGVEELVALDVDAANPVALGLRMCAGARGGMFHRMSHSFMIKQTM